MEHTKSCVIVLVWSGLELGSFVICINVIIALVHILQGWQMWNYINKFCDQDINLYYSEADEEGGDRFSPSTAAIHTPPNPVNDMDTFSLFRNVKLL